MCSSTGVNFLISKSRRIAQWPTSNLRDLQCILYSSLIFSSSLTKPNATHTTTLFGLPITVKMECCGNPGGELRSSVGNRAYAVPVWADADCQHSLPLMCAILVTQYRFAIIFVCSCEALLHQLQPNSQFQPSGRTIVNGNRRLHLENCTTFTTLKLKLVIQPHDIDAVNLCRLKCFIAQT